MQWYWKVAIVIVVACIGAGFLCHLHERKREMLEKDIDGG